MISKDNFIMVAMKAYDNPQCKTLIEFEEDLSKFSNLVRLCSKDTGPIETHLILNLVLVLLNIFEPNECIKMMFFKVKENNYNKLKTILTYLDRMPQFIPDLGIKNSEIQICPEMTKILKLI